MICVCVLLERRFGSHEKAARAIVLKDKTQLAGTSIVIKVNWGTGATTGAAASASASAAFSAATFSPATFSSATSVAPSASASSSATSTPSKSTVAALPVLPASLSGLSALEPSYLAALLKFGGGVGFGVPGLQLQLPPISQALPSSISQAQAALAAQLSTLPLGALPLSLLSANGVGGFSPVTTNLNTLKLSQLLGQTAAAPVPAPSSAHLTAANSAALLAGLPPAVLLQLSQSLLAGAQLPSRAGPASVSPAPAIARQQQQSATLQASSALAAPGSRQLLQAGVHNNQAASTSSSSAQTFLANAQMAALQGSQPPKPPAPQSQSQPQPQITFSSPPVLRVSNAYPNPNPNSNPNTASSKHVAHVSTAFPTVSASAPAAQCTPSSVPQTNSSDSGLSPDQNPPLHLSPDEPVLKQHRLSCSLQSQPQPQPLAAAALNGARLVAMQQQQRTPPSSTLAAVYSSELASNQQTRALVSPAYTGDSSPSEAAADVMPVAVPAVSLQQHQHQLISSLPVHKYSLAAGLPAVSSAQAFSQMLQQQNNHAVLAAAADGACRATGAGASGDSLALLRAQLALLGACGQAQASTAMPVGMTAGASGSSSVSPLLLVPVGAPASQTSSASASALSRLPMQQQQQLLLPGTANVHAPVPNLLSGFEVGGPVGASAAGGAFSLFGLPPNPNSPAGGFLTGASLPALGGLSVPSAMLRPPALNLMGLGAGLNASPAGAFSALQTLQALQLLSAPNSLHF